MRRLVLLVSLLLALAFPVSAHAQSAPFCAPGQSPEFVFGFKALKEAVGAPMGEPEECEHTNPDNNDSLQKTTTGLSFYRWITNTPTFTNGFEHWALTSRGLIYWTGESIDPPGVTVLNGSGASVTQEVTPAAQNSVMRLIHRGQRNFIVQSFRGGNRDQFLANEIGAYDGTTWLRGSEPVTFDVLADGSWMLAVYPFPVGGTVAFAGKGDMVSPLFDPPAPAAPITYSHDGRRNFIVQVRCAVGQDLVVNEIGAVSGSRMVDYGQAPCFWHVQADGNWTLQP